MFNRLRGDLLRMATVTKGHYASVESQIYEYVINKLGYNTAIACGILANVEAESGFRPNAVGDGGNAYGLFQWNDRRKSLFKYTNTTKPGVAAQLDFMKYELYGSESSARKTIEGLPNTAQGAYEAAYKFCVNFERPSDRYNKGADRGNKARNVYWSLYSGNPVPTTNSVPYIGASIVKIARDNVGVPYKAGGNSPTSGFDEAGFIYYCYTKAGKSIEENTVKGYYNLFKESGRSVNISNISPGDLLFYEDKSNTNVINIAIATGTGIIYADSTQRKVIELENSLNNPSYIYRILSDAETMQEYGVDVTVGGADPLEYDSFTSHDPYTLTMGINLSRVKAEGFDYGYLIDMTHGGEFKFYVPEFTEQAGANWGDISIRGRSVTVKSYESTNSRSINISLDLYAGVGVYKSTSGEDGEETVSRLHRDAFFIKSLEYPDYSNVITRPPSVVNLILGPSVNISGVVSNVIIEHMKPFDSLNRSMYLKVSFTVTQIAVNPIDYSNIRNGQYTLATTENAGSLDPSLYTTTPATPQDNFGEYRGGEYIGG